MRTWSPNRWTRPGRAPGRLTGSLLSGALLSAALVTALLTAPTAPEAAAAPSTPSPSSAPSGRQVLVNHTPGTSGSSTGWKYNCRGLVCLVAACHSGVGLGNVRYYQFGVNVRPSARPGYDREITQLVVTDMSSRREDRQHAFTELRMAIGNGGTDYVFTRRLDVTELGRVIDLPAPVPIRPGYQKYVGIYVNSNTPGVTGGDSGQLTGGCPPVMA